MSIKQRLILSNIAMVLIPFGLFILIELIAVYVLLIIMDHRWGGADSVVFTTIRITGLLFAITVSNGVITYYISKTILVPVRKLAQAAEQIALGNLEFSLSNPGKDEIGELTAIFERMRGKLLEARELQRKYEDNRKQLIASISHDLRTPITSMKGYARGILDGVARSPEKLEHYAQIIYTNANAMEKLIEELFLYSKLDLDQVPMQLERIDVRNYVADYVEELQFSLEPSGVRLRCSAPPGSMTDAYIVLADRDQLRRVVDNIVQNSLKYMDKPEPSIEVRLHAGEDVVTVEIEDNGIGIAPESLPYIFDSFYRADAARSSATGGSGLGMAIARRIVEAHGGRIWAASEPGAGTTISFRLNKPGRGGDALHAEHIDH